MKSESVSTTEPKQQLERWDKFYSEHKYLVEALEAYELKNRLAYERLERAEKDRDIWKRMAIGLMTFQTHRPERERIDIG